jgi:CspA family cold shock protein
MKGKVKFFNKLKGFGFITGDDGKEYFLHQSEIKDSAMLRENDSVTFDVKREDRGPRAINVSRDKAKATSEEKVEEEFKEKSEKDKEESDDEESEDDDEESEDDDEESEEKSD